MGVAIVDLLMTIGADSAGAEAGLARTATAAETSTGKIKGLFDTAEKAIGGAMKEAVKHVAEAVGEMISKFVDAGMGANAAAESIAAGFDKLTGGALKIGAIVEETDKVKDFVLKLNNLAATVPLPLGKLIELKGAIDQLGLSSEHLPEILQTLTKNIAKVAGGDADAAKKFHELGIATDGWKDKAPGADTLLVQIGEHFKNSRNPILAMSEAEEVLGEHTRELAPLFQEGGAKLKALAEAHVENARVVEGSVSAFQHLHATESRLSDAMQNLLIPIFKVLAQVLDVILQAITRLIEWFTRFGHAAVAAGQLVADYYKSLARIMLDLWRPVFGWLKEALDAVMEKVRAVGQWFESMARIGLAAFTKVKDFLADQLQPVFKAVGEGVEWIVQKFDSLKQWIGRVKDAVFEMAKPVIDAFRAIAKEIEDFFHLHWGDVAKDAREAAAILGADVKKVIDAAKGPAPADADHQFGGDAAAFVEKNEAKKTNAVKQGARAREVIELQHHQNVLQIADKDTADWEKGLEAMGRDTQAEGKVIGALFKGMPAPLAPALETATSKMKQIMQAAAHNIATAFSSAIRGMIDGTQTLGQAFAKMGQQMLSNMESALQQMLSQWLEHHLMELFIHTQTKQGEVAVDQAASAEKEDISIREHLGEVFRAAKQAAVNAWKALSGIPVVGPALGAAAAAATFAAVMAFGSVTSAQGGFYEVDRDQLALIHKNEMVLPAGLASRLRDVVDGGFDSNAGRGVTVVVNHSVNAVDAESFQKTIRRHGNLIGNEVARVLKKKGFASR